MLYRYRSSNCFASVEAFFIYRIERLGTCKTDNEHRANKDDIIFHTA